MRRVDKPDGADDFRHAFRACRGYFVMAGIFSLGINLLYLAAPLYMLQVYDRVVSSGSLATLVMLTIALLMAFAALGALDIVRGRVLARAGVRLDGLLAGRVVAATHERASNAHSQPLRDFDTFRQFVSGPGISAAFDLPWAPVYIGVLFLLHPLAGFLRARLHHLAGADGAHQRMAGPRSPEGGDRRRDQELQFHRDEPA
jgi:ATP-binding cassette, subfamily C, bacterial